MNASRQSSCSENAFPGSSLATYSAMRAHRRITVLTDGYSTPFVAKTAINLLRYRPDDIVAVVDRSANGSTAQALLAAGGTIPVVGGLKDISDTDALYIGIAPPGGKLPAEWRPIIQEALHARWTSSPDFTTF